MGDMVTKKWPVCTCGVAGESETQHQDWEATETKAGFEKTKNKDNDLKACSRR